MIGGTAYGVVLNDRSQRELKADALSQPPYSAPPIAPVVYIKPRNCFAMGGAPVPVPHGVEALEVAATLALWFGRDCTSGDQVDACIGAACLALDVSQPHANFYRPAIRERCRDGFLPLGAFAPWSPALAAAEIATAIDGEEAHLWSLQRLVQPVQDLVSQLTEFMTLRAGDLLMVGLPGDAPRTRAGQAVTVRAPGLPTLSTRLEAVA